jgi:hypothetical protein
MMAGKRSIADELVFPSQAGSAIKPDNIAPRYLEPVLEKGSPSALSLSRFAPHVRKSADPGRRFPGLRERPNGPQLDSDHRGHIWAPDPGSGPRVGWTGWIRKQLRTNQHSRQGDSESERVEVAENTWLA